MNKYKYEYRISYITNKGEIGFIEITTQKNIERQFEKMEIFIAKKKNIDNVFITNYVLVYKIRV